VARDLSIPVGQITAIYARENGAGMAFELEDHEPVVAPQAPVIAEVVATSERDDEPTPPPPRPEGGRPKLQRIK
jgi:stringent starvation protein B